MKKKAHRGSKGSSTPSTSQATWHPLPVRLDHGSAFARHVFLRAPSKNAEGAADGRALFVAAVPSGWSEAHLRELKRDEHDNKRRMHEEIGSLRAALDDEQQC